MALRDRRIENFDDISLAACSQGLPICVSSTSFQKSSIGWPQQPPTDRVSDISKTMDFWWSNPQKGTIIGHFGAMNNPTIKNKAVEVMRLFRPVDATFLKTSWWNTNGQPLWPCSQWYNIKILNLSTPQSHLL